MRRRILKLFVFFICLARCATADMMDDLERHSLQTDHPFYDKLEQIFASSKTLDTERDLIKAGFKIVQLRKPMFAVAKHPALPGHLVKVHLHSSNRDVKSRWTNFITRCNSAERLRKLIQKEDLRHFTVPDKWIYTTPTQNADPVLIVTYMNIVSDKETKYAWKNCVGRSVLKELYCIIRNDCGSSKLVENVPYTKEGVFTCIDTEKSSQGDLYIKKYLSKRMRMYWDELVQREKEKK